jgi:hypothetical protein
MSINTEIGGATANSYVSVASANEYLESRSNNESWINISSNASTSTYATTWKENLLKQATREIDRTYRFYNSKYNLGEKGDDDYQNLEFPRQNTLDTNGDPLIPDEIKFATYEQALWIEERTGLKTTDAGVPIQRQLFSMDAENYMKNWIKRQVDKVGKWAWHGF